MKEKHHFPLKLTPKVNFKGKSFKNFNFLELFFNFNTDNIVKFDLTVKVNDV